MIASPSKYLELEEERQSNEHIAQEPPNSLRYLFSMGPEIRQMNCIIILVGIKSGLTSYRRENPQLPVL